MRDPATGGLIRTCPHCGAAARTIGSACPSCGHDLTPTSTERAFMDRLPLIDTDLFNGSGSSAFSLLGLIVGLALNGVIVVVVGVPYALWYGTRRVVRVLGR